MGESLYKAAWRGWKLNWASSLAVLRHSLQVQSLEKWCSQATQPFNAAFAAFLAAFAAFSTMSSDMDWMEG